MLNILLYMAHGILCCNINGIYGGTFGKSQARYTAPNWCQLVFLSGCCWQMFSEHKESHGDCRVARRCLSGRRGEEVRVLVVIY